MSAPWSAFPVATVISNVDILAAVQGGINVQMPRPVLLTADVGDAIALSGAGATIGISSSGRIDIDTPALTELFVSQLGAGSTLWLWGHANGGLEINGKSGVGILIGDSGLTNITVVPNSGGGTASIALNVQNAGTFDLKWNTTDILNVSTGGIVNIACVTGQKLFLKNGSAVISIVGSGGITLHDTSGSSAVVTYVAGTPGNWSGSPTDFSHAIDRLAAAVAGLLGGPIP